MIAPFAKAGFNPDEPRVPAGQPGGGEWTDGAAIGSDDVSDLGEPRNEVAERLAVLRTPAGTDTSDDPSSSDGASRLQTDLIQAGYQLPPGMWAVVRGLYQELMAHGGDISTLMGYLEARGLQLDELPAIIQSLFDGVKPLAELQTDKPPAGFQTLAQLLAYLGAHPPAMSGIISSSRMGRRNPNLLVRMASKTGYRIPRMSS